MDQANAFTSGLEHTATYAIDGATLTLSDIDGNPLLVFTGTAAG
jgi:heat shock protein HslJ